MFCGIYARFLASYNDRQLPPLFTRMVGRHVSGCAKCRAALGRIGAVDRALGRLPAIDTPPHVDKALMGRIDAYDRERQGTAPHLVYRPAPVKQLSRDLLFNRRPVYAFARLAVVTVLILALTVTMLPDRSIAQAVEISGVVLVAQPGTANWQYLTKDMKIYKGMKFRFTGDKDFVDLKVARSDDVIRVQKIPVKDTARQRVIRVKVRKGKVTVMPLERPTSSKFKVYTPTKLVEIEGNTCLVNISKADGETNVVLEEVPA